MDERVRFPRISRRIQALLIDNVIVPILAIIALILARRVGLDGAYAAGLAASVVFTMEPFLVSVTGGTLGHHLLSIRVASKRTGKNINIFAALLRFSVKVALGIFSLFSLFFNKQYQAIHDVAVGSIVMLKHPEQMPAHEVLEERKGDLQEQAYAYPSRSRRVVMIVIYIVLSFLLAASLISERCAIFAQCYNSENALISAISGLWIVGIAVFIFLGWKGRLFGCRRQLRGRSVGWGEPCEPQHSPASHQDSLLPRQPCDLLSSR